MLAYMHAQNTFFHQGFDLFDDLDPYMKQVAGQVIMLNVFYPHIVISLDYLVKLNSLDW